MNFFVGFTAGLLAELKATFNVWRLLRSPFWVAYFLLLLATVGVAFLPGAAPPVGAGLLVVGLGLGAIFSGWLGEHLRRWRWVQYADGPEVVPYLPQALTLLLSPLFLVAMAVFFHALGPYLPGLYYLARRDHTGGTLWEPVEPTWWRAILLAIDNVLHTQIFFDFFEAFHLRFGPRPYGAAAATLVLAVRLLLDIAFIKLAVQLIRAAYFRAMDLGRGGDLIAQTRAACEAEDVGAARLHSRDVGQSVRAAAEDLRSHHEAGGRRAEQAWLGLRAMKDFALGYFEDRALTQLGEERERTQALIGRLQADDGPPPAPRPAPLLGWLALVAAYVVLAALTLVAWRLPAYEAWPLSVGLFLLQGWFLIRPRRWLDRLDAWGILPSPPPNWLPLRVLVWLLLLLPLFTVNASEVVYLVGRQVPGTFHAPALGKTVPAEGDAVGFVLENLLRTQIFADSVELYGYRVDHLHQEGALGGILTFLIRLVFNVGLLAVLVPFLLERFNQWFRGLTTRPDAELLLRREARACGPHSALLVAYYFGQVRDWFVEAMHRHEDDAELLAALAASGFVRDFHARYPEAERPDEDASREVTRPLERAQAFMREGRIGESEEEIRRAVALLGELHARGRADLDDLTAAARYVQGRLAMLRSQAPEAEAHLREALALIRKRGGDEVGSPYSAQVAELLDALAVVVGATESRAPDALRYAERSVDLFGHFVARGQADFRASLAHALGTRGRLLNLLQRWPEAVESLKNALGLLEEIQAETTAAALALPTLLIFGGPGPKRPDVRDSISQLRLQLADVYRELRQFGDAAVETRKAIALLEDLEREGKPGVAESLARALNNLGLSLNDDGKADEAQPVFERGRQVCEKLILEGNDTQRELLAPLLNNLGLLLLNKGQHDLARAVEAESHFRRAIEIIQLLIGEGQAQRQELLVSAYSNLSQALMLQKKMHEAEEEVGKAVEIGRKLVAAGQSTLRDEVALVLSNLGWLLTLKYQWGPAVEAFRESVYLYAQVVGGGAEQYRPLWAQALDRLSLSLRRFGEYDEAEEQGRAAVEQFRILVEGGKAKQRELAGAIRTLGQAHHDNRHFDQALERFREAAGLLTEADPEDRVLLSWLLVDQAATHAAQERRRDAIDTLDRAIVLQTRLVEGGRKDLQPDLAGLLNSRGDLLYNEGDVESALTAYRLAVQQLKPLVNAGRRDLRENLARIHHNVALSLVKLGEPGWPEAFQATLALYGDLVREGDPGAAEMYFPVADGYLYALNEAKRLLEAEPMLRQVVGTYAAAAADPRNHRARLGEARARLTLGLVLAELGKQAAFTTEAETALTLLEDLHRLPDGPDRAPRQYREAAGIVVNRLLAVSPEEAERVALRVLGFLEEVLAAGQNVTGAVIEALERLAQVQERRGDKEEALASLRQAQGHMPDEALDAYSMGSPAVRIFGLLSELGRPDEAAELARQAVTAVAAEAGETPDASAAATLAGWHHLLARAELRRGNNAAAAESLREALALRQGTDSPPADVLLTFADLIAAGPDDAVLRQARDYLQGLGGPADRQPEEAAAARELLARVARLRPDDAEWNMLAAFWKAGA